MAGIIAGIELNAFFRNSRLNVEALCSLNDGWRDNGVRAATK